MGVPGLKASEDTLGSLLRERTKISVPMYQRFYSWEKKQVEKLLADIANELDKPKKDARSLFLGTIVFHNERNDGGRTADLIDGQQRLFTLSLIQWWWIRRLSEINTQSSGAALQLWKSLFFIEKVKDLAKLSAEEVRELLRLHPSLHDRPTYEGLVKNKPRKRGRLVTAFKSIDDHFTQMCNKVAKEREIRPDPDNEEYAELVVDLAERVYDLVDLRISFAVIEVSPPLTPFAVFEGLNSTGLELAQSDLIKNFLLKRLDSEPIQREAQQKWDQMLKAVPGERIVDFLRAWYIANYSHVQRAQLYDEFQKLLTTKEKIRSALDDWVRAAWWYRAFYEGKISENHEDMVDVKLEPAFKKALEDCGKLGFRQGLAVLLALSHPDVCNTKERSGQLRLVKGIRILEAAYVRLFVSGNVRGSVFENKLEKMCEVSRTQKQQAIASLAGIVRNLCEAEQVDEVLDWSTVARSVSESRFLLYRIAEFQGGNAITLLGSDKWHVEHIMPQTPLTELDEQQQEEYDELVGRVGNLTVLLEGDNTSLGNRKHTDKVPIFASYDGKSKHDLISEPQQVIRPRLPLNLDIATHWPKDWNKEAIEKRGHLLGQYANLVWPLKDA